LWVAFLALISAVIIRLTLKFYLIIQSGKEHNHRWRHVMISFARMALPFHKAAAKLPFRSVAGYVFHICLIAVPIGFSAHIALWEDSRFEWSWTALPDIWADVMTLALLALAAGMIIRLFAGSKPRGGWVLFFVILPFASGFLLTHGTLEPIPFFADYLFTIHILTAELLFLMVAFLFLRVRIDPQTCVGCAACELNCPTAALDQMDKGDRRTFTYRPYQCIACGNCVNSCPEGAVRLQHHLSFGAMVSSLFREPIGSVQLQKCAGCGKSFAPQPQVDKIAHQMDADYLRLCEECKESKNAAEFYQKAS